LKRLPSCSIDALTATVETRWDLDCSAAVSPTSLKRRARIAGTGMAGLGNIVFAGKAILGPIGFALRHPVLMIVAVVLFLLAACKMYGVWAVGLRLPQPIQNAVHLAVHMTMVQWEELVDALAECACTRFFARRGRSECAGTSVLRHTVLILDHATDLGRKVMQ